MQQFYFSVPALFVIAGVASAIVIALDLRTCRQPMRIMQPVWILTGLWANLFALVAYFWFGRAKKCALVPPKQKDTRKGMKRDTASKTTMDERPERTMEDKQQKMPEMPAMTVDKKMGPIPGMTMSEMPEMGTMVAGAMPGMTPRPLWQSVILSTLHCGAGCTLADLVGEWLLWFFPVAIGGSLVAGSWAVDYALALVFGIGFQYAAIRGMERRITRGAALGRAARADVLSLTAWQAGMYAWMAVVIFHLGEGEIPARDGFYFWAMMQLAMGCGFLAALPVNVWLIRRGVKHPM